MHTHQDLARAAASVIISIDAIARLAHASPAERLQLAADTIIDALKLAQDELLASQQETADMLARALNMAGK